MPRARTYLISFQPLCEEDLEELLAEIPGGPDPKDYRVETRTDGVRLTVLRRSTQSDAVLRLILDHGLQHSSVRIRESC